MIKIIAKISLYLWTAEWEFARNVIIQIPKFQFIMVHGNWDAGIDWKCVTFDLAFQGHPRSKAYRKHVWPLFVLWRSSNRRMITWQMRLSYAISRLPKVKVKGLKTIVHNPDNDIILEYVYVSLWICFPSDVWEKMPRHVRMDRCTDVEAPLGWGHTFLKELK